MSDFYDISDVVDNLRAEYSKTPEYKNSELPLVGIKQDHPIIIRREEEGLDRIVDRLQNELGNSKILYLKKLQQRTPAEWIKEWLTYHKTLFERVFRLCGRFRRIDVWFDTMDASENDYKIPSHILVPSRMSDLAGNVCALLKDQKDDLESKLKTMSKIHFEFIRIHPFTDGNGRIGRLIIDQLCLAFSLPTVMGGYPRADLKQRKAYHEAIKDCCYDLDCSKLMLWIRSKLEERSKQLT